MQLSDVQALKLWHEVVLEQVRDELPDLSLRQMAVLLTVYLDPPPHTVRGLAKKLGVTKPVITRALNAMSRHQLLERRRDPHDRRNVLVQRTLKGALYLEALAEMIREKAAALNGGETAADTGARDDAAG
jgi:DNA-binding MarR family transcriptional regulator